MQWSRTLKLNYNLCIEPKSNVVIMRSCLSISSFWTQLSPLFFLCLDKFLISSAIRWCPGGSAFIWAMPKAEQKRGQGGFWGSSGWVEICFVKSSASQKNRWQLSSFILYRQTCPWQESELDLNILLCLKNAKMWQTKFKRAKILQRWKWWNVGCLSLTKESPPI